MAKTPDIDVTPSQWATIAAILSQGVPDAEVWAFGSRAKGTARARSDLDLVIRADKPLTLLQLANLGEAFSESDLPFKVDVVDWAATQENFQRIITAHHVVVTPLRHG